MSATSVEKRATRVVAARKKRAGAVAMTVVLGIAAIVWLSPLALLIITALRPLSDYIANGALTWPKQFTIGNFAQAWDVGNFATTYRNSFIITVVKVPLGVFFTSLLAYAIAKLRLPGRNIVMFGVFLGLTVPIYIAILPNFIMLRQLGITDSLAGLLGPISPSVYRSRCWCSNPSSGVSRTRSSKLHALTAPVPRESSSRSYCRFPLLLWSLLRSSTVWG